MNSMNNDIRTKKKNERPDNKLSIVIPAFNESFTILKLLDKVLSVKLIFNTQKEIILIDDHSSDDTSEKIENYIISHPESEFNFLKQKKNIRKGAAIKKGIELATGNFIIIQDADLEYDPEEYNLLLQPLLDGVADVVYGSRFMSGNPHRILFFGHTQANKFLTFLSNLFTGLHLSDMETCYKLFRTDILKSIRLKENRFGFEPEVTAKLSRIQGIRIYEVGISYYGRTYYEGKKIGWKDGVRSIWCILKYNLWSKI